MKFYSKSRTPTGSSPELNGEINFWNYLQKKVNLQIVFDVGIEKTSHLVDHSKDDKIQFYLFEPNTVHYEHINQRYLNKQNIKLYNFGFGNLDNQETKIYTSTGSIFLRDKINKNVKNESLNIKLRTIESFTLEQNIKKIDFLKIDVEGYEYNILLGAASMLKNINLIQFEYGGTYLDAGVKLRDVLSFFSDRSIYLIEKDGLNFQNISELSKKDDEYFYANFIVSNNRLEEL
jgi:FkbM family methyltransferase